MNVPTPDMDIIDVEVADDMSNKSIVLKVSNTILAQSVTGPNFITILYVNQSQRDNLLRDLLDSIQPQNFSKVFFIDELVANPVANKLVPKQRLCTRETVDKLLRDNFIIVDALPKMLLRDPIARWYGWKVDDVVEVIRSNGETYYRLVV